MSVFPKYLPGTSFSNYLKQEKQKEGGGGSSGGIFQRIEATMLPQAPAKDIDFEPQHSTLRQRIKDETGGGEDLTLRYRGTLDGRIPRPYPGPGAKEGHFWVVEFPGHIGSDIVGVGDVLVRFNGFSSDWVLIESNKQLETPIKITQKQFTLLGKPQPKQTPRPPATKEAPAPGKRKIVLEDD